MEPSDPHVHLVNPLPKSTGTFHNFSKLSTEIRCAIWEHILSQERLLRVHLFSPRESINLDLRASSVNWAASGNYVIFVTQPTLSRLFLVNVESRLSALRFYRVQLPCRYFRSDHAVQDGTLYINPELDTLDIRGIHHFVKFAYDLWVHDPRDVGLLNLAIAQTWSSEIRRLYTWDAGAATLRQVLSRLKRVMFMQQIARDQLLMEYGPDHSTQIWRERDRWVPMMGTLPTFSRQPGPKGIDKKLKQLYIGDGNWRHAMHSWFSLLASLEVESTCNYKVALNSLGKEEFGVRSRKDALEIVEHKNTQWGLDMELLRKRQPEKGLIQHQEHYPGLYQTSETAVGFRVFPMESLGPLPRLNADPSRKWRLPWSVSREDRYIDLSEYEPELCLFDLW
ncbi:hypothetical protein ACHAPJ_011846 [Fusarium lateritium]